MAASLGQLDGREPRFEAASAVSGGGVLTALPSLLRAGLLRHADRLTLPKGFYGLPSLLLWAFLLLGRVRNPERLRYQQPGEWGALLPLPAHPAPPHALCGGIGGPAGPVRTVRARPALRPAQDGRGDPNRAGERPQDGPQAGLRGATGNPALRPLRDLVSAPYRPSGSRRPRSWNGTACAGKWSSCSSVSNRWPSWDICPSTTTTAPRPGCTARCWWRCWWKKSCIMPSPFPPGATPSGA